MRLGVGSGALMVVAACGSEPDDIPRPTQEGAATILAWEQSSPRAIAASEQGVFWLTFGGIAGLPSTDAEPVVIASLSDQQPVELCLTPSELYVATFGAGSSL